MSERLIRQWGIVREIRGRWVLASDLADRFGVCRRTISRDLDVLSLVFPVEEIKGHRNMVAFYLPRHLGILEAE